MTSVRIASYNVENFFARPKAFDPTDPEGENVVQAHAEFNTLIAKATYAPADKQQMLDLLVVMEIFKKNNHGAVRRNQTTKPKYAWLRKNHGTFDSEPKDPSRDVEIRATGRDTWIGWAELAVENVDAFAIRLTGRVIQDVDADIIGIIEAEDRPALVRFNREFIGLYRHVMLVDGNDDRGIDVGLMTKTPFDILDIRSHVDDEDDEGPVFSRDCADYRIQIPGGTQLHVLVNHFKSQSGGGGERRLRQATRVRALVDELVAAGESVVVIGDLNEGQADDHTPAANLAPLFDPHGPLNVCYDLPGFNVGARPGTFDACGIRNRLDYIFVTDDLKAKVQGGGVFRCGLWGTRKTRPTDWDTYQDLTDGDHQASDHAAVFIDLNL